MSLETIPYLNSTSPTFIVLDEGIKLAIYIIKHSSDFSCDSQTLVCLAVNKNMLYMAASMANILTQSLNSEILYFFMVEFLSNFKPRNYIQILKYSLLPITIIMKFTTCSPYLNITSSSWSLCYIILTV